MADIAWTEANGTDRFLRVAIIDISEAGMHIQVPEPLQERMYVTVRAETFDVHGTGSVRSCIRKGLRYRVGLEFTAGLKWKHWARDDSGGRV